MSAETLRRAAALMRERAEAASPGPWAWHEYARKGDDGVPYMTGRGGDPETYAYDTEVIEPDHSGECGCRSACRLELRIRVEDRAHIASWHPAVALAVADWLDEESLNASLVAHTNLPTDAGWSCGCLDCKPTPALAAACAYLGED